MLLRRLWLFQKSIFSGLFRLNTAEKSRQMINNKPKTGKSHQSHFILTKDTLRNPHVLELRLNLDMTWEYFDPDLALMNIWPTLKSQFSKII
jgi:hypothetical protein